MATERIMVIPMLVTQHNTPIHPAVTAKQLLPLGEDPMWDT